MRARRLSFIHLSGPRRGFTDAVTLPAVIGPDENAAVRVPGLPAPIAHLFTRGSDVVVQDAGSGTEIHLAGQPVHEAVLRDGDLLELGATGPKLRFRDYGVRGTSFRQALDWARPEGPRRALSDVGSYFRALFREANVRTSSPFRLMVMALLAALSLALAWSAVQSHKMKDELVRLRGAMAAAYEEQQAFRERVDAERHRFDEDRKRLGAEAEDHKQRERELNRRLAEAQAGEVRAVRSDLQATRERILTLETDRAAASRIIRDYGPGVCLIQGTMVFADASGRLFRYVLDDSGRPRRQPSGDPALDPMGRGEIHKVDYVGTGFLVDGRGLVLTNRHVAEPWWKDASAQELVKAGASARLLTFRAFFPREAEPMALSTERVSESVNLALLRLDLRGRKVPAPAIPLDHTGRGAIPGQPVVVLGYPAGIEALVAKADTETVNEIVNATGMSSARIAEGLAAKSLIRPSATQGHIGDVTDTDIVFDAQTTHGGSGGPVLNRGGQVVAVEYAVLAGFGGNSFGVPVRYAIELLKAPKVKGGG